MAGYQGIITPYGTKAFEAMVEAVTAEFVGNAVLLEVVGVDLRRELPRAKNVNGRHGLMGADLHLAAWQVARQFARASAAQTASAAAVSRALSIYHGTFHGRRAVQRNGRFDAAA
jgi:hypothetical protein